MRVYGNNVSLQEYAGFMAEKTKCFHLAALRSQFGTAGGFLRGKLLPLYRVRCLATEDKKQNARSNHIIYLYRTLTINSDKCICSCTLVSLALPIYSAIIVFSYECLSPQVKKKPQKTAL